MHPTSLDKISLHVIRNVRIEFVPGAIRHPFSLLRFGAQKKGRTSVHPFVCITFSPPIPFGRPHSLCGTSPWLGSRPRKYRDRH